MFLCAYNEYGDRINSLCRDVEYYITQSGGRFLINSVGFAALTGRDIRDDELDIVHKHYHSQMDAIKALHSAIPNIEVFVVHPH